MSKRWLLWQLCDSAFPSGGFAHSGGLEAAAQLGELTKASARDFLRDYLSQQAGTLLPFVMTAWREPSRLPEWDAAADAFLSAPVTNRASRALGQGWLSAVAQSFGSAELLALRERARGDGLALHLAPVFGVCARALLLSDEETAELFLFSQLRGAVSAAVRLNVVGPIEAQVITTELHDVLTRLAHDRTRWELERVAQEAPLLELFAAHHDRLYSRLFQS